MAFIDPFSLKNTAQRSTTSTSADAAKTTSTSSENSTDASTTNGQNTTQNTSSDPVATSTPDKSSESQKNLSQTGAENTNTVTPSTNAANSHISNNTGVTDPVMDNNGTLQLDLSMKGQQCSFRTIHPNDANTYTGTIVGVGVDSDIANSYTDIQSYNTAVRYANPSVSQDLTQLDFFIISITNPSGNNEKVAFAQQWIQEGSFSLIGKDIKRTFTVYSESNVTSKDIINVLRAAGFTAIDTTQS